MEQGEGAVQVIGIHRRFGEVHAVKGVSLAISQGEFLSLLGPSGSGKTTLLRVIAGFEEASEGEVVIGGRSMSGVPANHRNIGVVFQHLALFPHLNVFRNVSFGLEMRRVDATKIRKSVAEALEMVRLVGFADRMPNQLSGGQQQRVALARALVIRPALMLLDEPLGSLDPHLRSEMQVEVRQLQQAIGITTIMVTHDQQEAMIMGDRIAVLHEGSLRQLGTPQDIYGNPASAFVARFLGDANVFSVSSVSQSGDKIVITTTDALEIVAVGSLEAQLAGRLVVVLRPETIKLGVKAEGLENRFPGRVLWVTYLGAQTRCRISIGKGTEITALVPRDDVPVSVAGGDEVLIGWSATATRVAPEL